MKWKRRLYWKFILLPYFPSTQKQGLCSVCFASKPRERGLVIDEGSILCSLLYWILASSMSIYAGKKQHFWEKESKSCFPFPILCLIFLATFSLWSGAGCDRRIDRGKSKALLSSWSPASYELLISLFLFLLLLLSILSFFTLLDMNYHILLVRRPSILIWVINIIILILIIICYRSFSATGIIDVCLSQE